MASFQLPKDGAIYAEAIFSRCRDLIAYGIWSGIEPHRLDTWILNFVTPEEQYFAARVLDNLIYRSDQQTAALMKQMFLRVLPDLSRSAGLPASLRAAYTSLRQSDPDPAIRLVPVIPPRETPTKSGTVVARMLRRRLHFLNEWFVHATEVSGLIGQIDTFVLVDDFMGTGIQFSDFLSETGLNHRLRDACFIYAPLAAHVDGIDYLAANYPAVHVAAVDLLDKSHGLFHEEAGSFPDQLNSCEDARDFYYRVLADRNFDVIGPDRRGFGHFELVYAFQHAAPDNSLPILWWDKSTAWSPLFDR